MKVSLLLNDCKGTRSLLSSLVAASPRFDDIDAIIAPTVGPASVFDESLVPAKSHGASGGGRTDSESWAKPKLFLGEVLNLRELLLSSLSSSFAAASHIAGNSESPEVFILIFSSKVSLHDQEILIGKVFFSSKVSLHDHQILIIHVFSSSVHQSSNTNSGNGAPDHVLFGKVFLSSAHHSSESSSGKLSPHFLIHVLSSERSFPD